MILFKGCELYTPDFIGRKDVFVAGSQVVAIEEWIDTPTSLSVEVVQADEFKMIPGLIDIHCHLTGGGGEGGPATRTPELQLSQFLEAGVTTAVGCLGTDGFVRTIESLLMKAKGLNAEGMSCWIFSGAYQVPTPTLFHDPAKDLMLIEEIIGLGEVAIADHRSSGPTVQDLIHLGHHAHVGGMLGGKSGVLHIHMGDGKNPFQLLYDAVERSELSLKQFFPTHCTRNHTIFEDSKTYAKKGYIDLTAGSYPLYPDIEVKPSVAITEFLDAGVPLEHITISSDAGGSMPIFDEAGKLLKLDICTPKALFVEFMDLVKENRLPLELALKVVTSNPADILGLPRKGRLQKGHDADMVLLDDKNEICYVVARGEFMVKNYETIKKGTFEK